MSDRQREGKRESRREFFKKAAVIGLSAAGGSLLAQNRPVLAQAKPPQAPMPRRPFGRAGIMVSILSLGGMFDILNNRLMLVKALDWGVNYWDTAEGYGGGRSEQGIGLWFARNPQTRKQVFLVSKLRFRSGDDPTAHLEDSLKRLHTDYLDLVFVHGIKDIKQMTEQMGPWSQAMKKAGKIRLFGFSTHANMEACLEGAAKIPWIDGIMFTYNYRLMHDARMNAAVQACYDAGIGLTAMKTQGGGPVKTDTEAEIKMAGRFLQKGFTDYQAKLKAIWEDKRIACICSQMPNLTILAANTAAAKDQTKLTRGDRAALAQYAASTCGDYCAGCGRLCLSALERPLPVSDVMRCLMYQRAYQDAELARSAFAELSAEEKGLLTRLDFAAAEKACPRGLPIGRLMQEAAALLA